MPIDIRKLIVLFFITLIISACGTGEGNIGFADGQSPDPVAVDYPIAYVKRPLPVDDNGNLLINDVRELLNFRPGADLFVRPRSSSSTSDTNVTSSITQGEGDVRDAEFSYDGNRVVFSMREPLIDGADEADQPTWNIWEYEISSRTLRRIIASSITAEAGHDIAPYYLPDDRIVFSSTRQRQSRAILLDEGKPQFAAEDENRNEPAFVLHVMNNAGGEIKQISYNQSHDMDPSVLSNGQIVFSRWDHAPGNDAIHLYRSNPDGTELELLYGANSHETGTTDPDDPDPATDIVQFLQPREHPDGQLLSILKPAQSVDSGGNVVAIDTASFVENEQPVASSLGLTGPAQVPATTNIIITDTSEPSPGGRYDMVFPLWDGTNRLFVSWSLCRLMEGDLIVPCTEDRLANPDAIPAPPLYGIWLYDQTKNTQLPVVVPIEGFMFTDITAAQELVLPPVILDKQGGAELDADLVNEGAGVINIRSVYDIDGVDTATPNIATLADAALTTANQRPARFLRVVKAVSMPDNDVYDFSGSAFGVTDAQGMREIVAYSMIEPDGSVRVKVPANVALDLQILDKDGKRINTRHRNWLQARPGEIVQCNGCHDPDSETSHGRQGAFDPAYTVEETQAEERARLTCVPNSDCSMQPSLDMIYEDVWTDPIADGRAPDMSFAYRYADLETLPPVNNTDCLTEWSPACRSTIQYETHIHPIWSKDRAANTCTICHNIVDVNDNPRIPAAQISLIDGASTVEADHFKAYRELLGENFEEELVGGVLQEKLVPGLDADGNAIMVPVPLPITMSAGSATDSAAFFTPFDAGGTHQGYLTDAEKRLLLEWVDIGAQYYNNPFDAPEQ